VFTSALQEVWKDVVLAFGGTAEAKPLPLRWQEFPLSFQKAIPAWAYQRYCNYCDKSNKRSREDTPSPPPCTDSEDEGDKCGQGSSKPSSVTDTRKERTSKKARKVL
jgi:hypothetical protein